jgi:hypothetical protein
MVVAAIFGGLTWLGSGFAVGLASGGTCLIVGVFVRVLVLDSCWRFFGEDNAIKGASTAGAVGQ